MRRRFRARRITLSGEPLLDGATALRPWRDTDQQALVDACRDPEIARWTRVPAPYEPQDATEFFARVRRQRAVGEGISFAIVAAPDGELLGSMDLRVLSWEPLRGEIGYLVGARSRGRSVAPCAVRLLSLIPL